MIFLRISSDNIRAIESVAEMLIRERLAMDLNVKRNLERWYLENGQVHRKEVFLLTSKTKGLLFGKIDELIKGTFPDIPFEIYSVPILHMDWDETKQLQQGVMEV